MTAVADSSPLIALASISAFQFLETLFGNLVVPEAVHAEVVLQGSGRPGEREVTAAAWTLVRKVGDSRRVGALRRQHRIRDGEAEAIVLADELGADWLSWTSRWGARRRSRPASMRVA